MKTEAEARKCICPMTFSPLVPGGHETHPGGGSSWGTQMPEFKKNCIASECMAWRWYYDEDKIERGFCGLAGETGIQRNSRP